MFEGYEENVVLSLQPKLRMQKNHISHIFSQYQWYSTAFYLGWI